MTEADIRRIVREELAAIEAKRRPVWPEGQEGLFYVNPKDRSVPLAGKTASAEAADLEAVDKAVAIDEGRLAAIRQADPHALLPVVSLSSLTGRDVPVAIERFPVSFARSYARQMRDEARRPDELLFQREV